MKKVAEDIKHRIEENKKAAKEGKNYESGIAVLAQKQAQKTVNDLLTQRSKNNRNLPSSEKVCKFFPSYCSIPGHSNSRSRHCAMHGKTTAKKEAAMAAIKKTMIMSEAAKVGERMKGTYSRTYRKRLYGRFLFCYVLLPLFSFLLTYVLLAPSLCMAACFLLVTQMDLYGFIWYTTICYI